MWCSFCQQEVPGELSADSLSICCTYCSSPENILLDDLTVATTPRPQLPRLGTIRDQLANPQDSGPSSISGETSVRCHVARIDELREAAREQRGSVDVATTTPPRMAGFFLMVFLFGQLMCNWGLYCGHYAAWLSGLAFSAFGFAIAVCSLLSQINLQNRTIRQLTLPSADKPATIPAQPHLAYSDSTRTPQATTQKVSA